MEELCVGHTLDTGRDHATVPSAFRDIRYYLLIRSVWQNSYTYAYVPESVELGARCRVVTVALTTSIRRIHRNEGSKMCFFDSILDNQGSFSFCSPADEFLTHY